MNQTATQDNKMKNLLNATEAIEKIKSVRTTFLGRNVRKYNHAIEIREELEKMAHKNEISPRDYLLALDITWPDMGCGEKRKEFEALNSSVSLVN